MDEKKNSMIPGTVSWIKKNKKNNYKKIIKQAAENKKHDPYATTKFIAVNQSLAIPVDIAFDTVTDTTHFIKSNRKKFGPGIKGVIKGLKSPEYGLTTLFKKQKTPIKEKFGSGIKGVAKALKSGEYGIKDVVMPGKPTVIKDFIKKQKGVAIPLAAAVATPPVVISYLIERKKLKDSQK